MPNDDRSQEPERNINSDMRIERFKADERMGKEAKEKIDPSDGDHRGLGKHKAK